ncbi:MAG: hypothetical protein ABI132_10730 [Rhodanobacteraceae bacterium]
MAAELVRRQHEWTFDWSFSIFSAMRSDVWIRRVTSTALILGIGAALASISSCVLFDAPADLPLAPTRRPTILRSQVTPSAAIPLGELPSDGQFIVPIEIPDPTQPVSWVAYHDLNTASSASDAHLVQFQTIVGSTNAANIPFPYPTFTVRPGILSANSCHTIRFVVSLSQTDDPDPNLSDSIDWFIVPAGNPGGCTTYDGGGVYGVITDASAAGDAEGG